MIIFTHLYIFELHIICQKLFTHLHQLCPKTHISYHNAEKNTKNIDCTLYQKLLRINLQIVKQNNNFKEMNMLHKTQLESFKSQIMPKHQETYPIQTSIEYSSRKKSFSVDKTTNDSPFRQTMHMKRYKYQKATYLSKPISIHNCCEQFFAVEPNPKEEAITNSNVLLQNIDQKECQSKMMPVNSSNWVSNTKKMQKKWLVGRRGTNPDPRIKYRPQKSFQIEMNNEVIINDIKQYFYSMKQYLNNHKKKVQRQRKIKVLQKNMNKKEFQQKNNLSIIRLRPQTQDNKYKNQCPNYEAPYSSPILIQQNSSNNFKYPMTSPSRETSYSSKSQTAEKFKKNQLTIFRRNSHKFQDFHYIFGKIKDSMPQQQLQRLRNLYYHDFIWKIWFNRGFCYDNQTEVYRYYVGKGNNSRLIRRIMSKRSWWVEETQQKNAHFIWTQLKVYDAYKNQKIGFEQTQKPEDEKDYLTNPNLKNSEIQQPQYKTIIRGILYQNGDKNSFILNHQKYALWRAYIKANTIPEKRPKIEMTHRKIKPKLDTLTVSHKITNHLQCSRVIGNKKALYRTMQAYFSYKKEEGYLPMTFHITGGLEDQQYFKFLREYYKKGKQGLNCWIVKPGELSNRGRDIKYCKDLKQIKDYIKDKKLNNNGSLRTYIVQAYIQKPFLYQNRKFDLRHYLMITSVQGKIRGYFYQQGYVRTTSYPYSLDNYQPAVHLTNDAVQKYLPQYGKFQKANKLSYQQLNEYMVKIDPKKGFFNHIFPQLKKIGTDIIHASFPFIDPHRRKNNFQIFGIDVMIDQNCNCWLIEVNTNPCIEVNCSVLANVIPQMLDNALAIGIDSNLANLKGKMKLTQPNFLQSNKFQLVFDQALEGHEILTAYRELNIQIGNFGDDDDNYQSCEQQDFQS